MVIQQQAFWPWKYFSLYVFLQTKPPKILAASQRRFLLIKEQPCFGEFLRISNHNSSYHKFQQIKGILNQSSSELLSINKDFFFKKRFLSQFAYGFKITPGSDFSKFFKYTAILLYSDKHILVKSYISISFKS